MEKSTKSVKSIINRLLSFSFIAAAFTSCAYTYVEPSGDNGNNGNNSIGDKGDCVSRTIEVTESEFQASKQSNVFAWGLLQECLAEEENQNVVISPMSANICLSMIANGADGESRAQMLNAMGFGESDMTAVNSLNSKIARQISGLDDNITLSLANSFWYDKDIAPKSAFLKDLKDNYDIESYVINPSSFVSDVNAWCNKKTNGLIPKVLKENTESDCAFLNALYFKSFWQKDYRFKKELTIVDDFRNASGTKSKVSYMVQKCRYPYHIDELWRAIVLPFSGGGFNFFVILPHEGVSVDECFSSIKSFGPATSVYDTQNLELKLPKLKINQSQNLVEVLKRMGISDIFDASVADFSNMTDLDMFVNLFKQDVSFELDEEGAEAAAVTTGSFIVTSSGYDIPKDTFYVDRPFIFMISEKSTGSIQFMGVINKL